MNHVDNSRGFTLVELLLAMSFVSLLLMAIALTVLKMGDMYTQGLTLKEVNLAGKSVSDDIGRSIAAATELSVDGSTATGFQEQKVGATVVGGRLCTGTVTYVWNLGREIREDNLTTLANRYAGGDTRAIRMIKVVDVGGVYCGVDLPDIEPTKATDMLPEGDLQLAVQSFAIKQVAHNDVSQQSMFQVILELGTNDQDALQSITDTESSIPTITTSCKPPNDEGSRQEYCAINKFEFTARVGSRGAEL
ncbi:hypothetical protein I8H84_03915 [Candidatus Saccharibacteria bacterium]|nr:hypothetical protein [Candidatus Saccharibacteria bacterium]MBH1973082.1 hypothetical protein [Candidatus Saccharibacteria bacterium]MBH1990676.1 hypothetical protein [Candidatus Saccharibacteria bacterium]